MKPYSGIKAIFLDYGGTLDADGIPWGERFYRLYTAHGITVAREKFDRAFYAADDSLTDEGCFDGGLQAVVTEQVRRALQGLGCLSADLHRRIAGDFYRASLHKIEANLPVLDRLKRSWSLGIISNNYGNLSRICVETGLSPYMDVMIDSNEVGCTKPDIRIFKAALDRLGLQPREALMVGDSPRRDMLGARAAGMPHVLLAGGPDACGDTCCPGDQVISRLDELPGLLAQ